MDLFIHKRDRIPKGINNLSLVYLNLILIFCCLVLFLIHSVGRTVNLIMSILFNQMNKQNIFPTRKSFVKLIKYEIIEFISQTK